MKYKEEDKTRSTVKRRNTSTERLLRLLTSKKRTRGKRRN